jgi:plastocyanin
MMDGRAAVTNTRAAAVLLAVLFAIEGSLAAVAHAAPATHTVVMEGMAFKPDTLTVKQGDTVVWVNKDLFPHTATANDRTFDSGELPANKSWRYAASKPGKHAYTCTFHPTMKAVLIVK